MNNSNLEKNTSFFTNLEVMINNSLSAINILEKNEPDRTADQDFC